MQQFSQQQQALINERLRIEKLPKSSRSINNDLVVGDLITDGYRFYIVAELQSYNGYKGGLMVLFCLGQCPNTGKWGYLQYITSRRSFSIMDRQ